jgi:asparagine synthase (glutamine-hydrolysing)
MRQSRTCLTHVTEVAPGAVSDLRDDGTTPVWHPWGFAQAAPTRDLAAVQASLRKTAIDCVSAWASLGGRVVVSASGGLDSSIVCACLAAAGHPFDCVTVSTPDPSGDESAHVRHLAAALGVRMIVKTFDPSTCQIETAASAGLPRPTRKAFMVQLRRLLGEACDELGADTVFDGNGGDNLFCYLHSAAPIIDRLREEGIDRALAGTFLDMCRVTECDIPTMARAVAKRMWSGPKPYWRPDDRLLALRGDLPGQLTPWWSAGSRNLPGKAAHIGLIQRSQNFEHGLCGEGRPHRFSVLMSQPLMEACLAIPSWQWCEGGINRALARAAFRDDLPEAILARRSKAGPDSVLRSVFARNRSLIRDMLLGGLLVGNGVLDAHAVERALQMDEHSDDQIVNRLLDVAEAEAWSRSWA